MLKYIVPFFPHGTLKIRQTKALSQRNELKI